MSECPYCGQAEGVVRELLLSFGEDLCYVWRHLPLTDVHAHAQIAAEAAEAAGGQGAFWPMHEPLLAHQDELASVDLSDYPEELGLDVDRFQREIRARRYAERGSEDVASADASGVAATPSFFVNGKRHRGAYDVASLGSAVRAARSRAAAKRAPKSRAAPVTGNRPGSSEGRRAPTLRRRDHAAAEIE
jgi:protein-disulfide isomerase